MADYNHQKIEQKWQKIWEAEKTFSANDASKKPKYFILDMFPYPSGAGLHVGHPEGYTATDILARYKRARGFEVLHPMGWDAFGLPAENYAIKTGTHPAQITAKNIANFKRQIQSLGFSYDWDREINTTDPEYFRWTQWIFLQLFESYFDQKTQKAKPIADLRARFEKEGIFKAKTEKEINTILSHHRLAYETEMPINWCPSCKTGLANEEVVNGKCDRCQNEVTRKNLRQWVLRITKYADRLLHDLESNKKGDCRSDEEADTKKNMEKSAIQWPSKIIAMQKNWIGKSLGMNIFFTLEKKSLPKITVFTTHPETLFGVTFLILSPEHPLISELVSHGQKKEIQHYIEQAAKKSDLERTELQKEKTGVFTGAFAIHPVHKKKIPIWISDYVLAGYGSGAIMGVPAHDKRDFAFAQKYTLEIIDVLETNEHPSQTETLLKNSDFLNGKTTAEAIQEMTSFLEEKKLGEQKVQYKLRDWIFSRQRYWGEPIPILHCEKCGAIADNNLPLRLPEVEKYEPSGTGESPLATISDFVETTCPQCDGMAKRETNTMPQWAGSCWYYLRYMDPKNTHSFCDSKREKKWGPVDMYVGGAEHAVLHLLYARFWHKVLFDLGYVSTKEPFQQLMNQGLILAEDGTKMSKSIGNVVNPDEIVEKYGADTLRIYEMFMGPFEQNKSWSTASVAGISKFLHKIWTLFSGAGFSETDGLQKVLHQTIQKVGNDIEEFKFNTAISQMMIFLNAAQKAKTLSKKTGEDFIKLLAPFAPHLAEEIWSTILRKKENLSFAPFPDYDAKLMAEDSVNIAVQINGKLRATIKILATASKDELLAAAKKNEKVIKFLEGKEVVKEIVVPGKIVNMVVR